MYITPNSTNPKAGKQVLYIYKIYFSVDNINKEQLS